MTEPTGQASLVLGGVRSSSAEGPVDVVIRGDRISEIVPAGTAPAAEETIDGRGTWAVPGLVDLHAHLDKTLLGLPFWPNPGGRTVLELAENERRARPGLPGTVQQRVETLLRRLVAFGTSFIRTHVDIDTTAGLSNLIAVQAAGRTFAGRIDIQTVAFPQSGMLRRPGTAELMREAMAAGADVVGGLDPAGVDADPIAHLDAVFDLADRVGAGLDIHLHDPGELGAWQIEQICVRTATLGLQGKVTISHAMALGEVAPARQWELLEQLANNRISIATVAPGRGQMLPVTALHEAGVNLGCGNDGVRDMWNPHATGDMVHRANLLAWRAGYRTDREIALALHAATHGGAVAMGLTGYGIELGNVADLALIPGETVGEVVTTADPARWVVKAGKVVSRPMSGERGRREDEFDGVGRDIRV